MLTNISHQGHINEITAKQLTWQQSGYNEADRKPTTGEHVAHPQISCTMGGCVNYHNNFGTLLGLAVCAKPQKKYMSYVPQFHS